MKIKKVSVSGTQYNLVDAVSDSIKNGYIVNDFATNCITKIPQDIKVEIDSDGYIVLKSGSVITYPNGTQYTTTSDSRSSTGAAGQRFVFAKSDKKVVILDKISSTVSGSTDSLAGTTYHTWFDTTNTQILRYGSSASEPSITGLSMPIAVVTVENGNVTSIDKVFNGAGYVGHHIFALPGIRSLAPDGKNADGTLNVVNNTKTNLSIIEMTTLNKLIYTSTTTTSAVRGYEEYDEQSDVSNPQSYRLYYFRKPNISCYYSSGAFVKSQRTPLVFFNYTGSSVTKFDVVQPKGLSDSELFEALKGFSGYDASKSQKFKNISGTFTWVDD